jgi:hypothetical protein
LHDVTVLARLVDAVGLMGQRARRRRRLHPHFPSARSCCRSQPKNRNFFSFLILAHRFVLGDIIDSLIKRSRESKCKCLNVVCFVLARHQ